MTLIFTDKFKESGNQHASAGNNFYLLTICTDRKGEAGLRAEPAETRLATLILIQTAQAVWSGAT
jgi:hypothetical protein